VKDNPVGIENDHCGISGKVRLGHEIGDPRESQGSDEDSGQSAIGFQERVTQIKSGFAADLVEIVLAEGKGPGGDGLFEGVEAAEAEAARIIAR